MSYIYAEKSYILFEDKKIPNTHIYSDTKITLDEAGKLNWGTNTYNAINRYGMIKSIIISPRCCISFAGNNIAYAGKLFEQLCERGSFSDEQLYDCALKIHQSAPPDDIEFIICIADDNDETHIACIKNNTIMVDCLTAWIGSRQAFQKMQQIRIDEGMRCKVPVKIPSGEAFKRALQESGDDSVGGFDILVTYDSSKHSFLYTERMETAMERPEIVEPGKYVRTYGTAAEGGCTIYYYGSSEDVLIEIEQADLSVLYTRKIRVENGNTCAHFLLPVPIRTSTQQVIAVE